MPKLRITAFIVAGLAGIAGLAYAALTETGGWSFPWLSWLVFWLPLTASLSLAVGFLLSRRTGLRWPAAWGVVGWIALAQYWTSGGDGNSRVPLAVMPLVLLVLSILALVSEWGEKLQATARAANRHGRWFLITAVVAWAASLACQSLWRMRTEQMERQRSAAAKAEADRKQRELQGLPRAAWMMHEVFYAEGFSEQQFLKDKRCELRFFGEFRWDDEQQRLVITQHLFRDEGIRKRLLPRAEEVLQHPLLKQGVRDDLQGGVLTCRAPLDCQVQWTLDTDRLDLEPQLRAQFARSADFIERRILQEFPKSAR